MRGIASALTALALVGVAGTFTTSPALADDTPAETPAETTETGAAYDLAAADGYFYAADYPYGKGEYCRWSGNDSNWETCKDGDGDSVYEGMYNRASQMFNNGFPVGYDDVNVYWGLSYEGAYRCLARGNHWDDLPLNRETFNHRGTNGRGYGESLNNNVASHKWVNSC